jgi:type I restriction-modification system DNA methylase subunit
LHSFSSILRGAVNGLWIEHRIYKIGRQTDAATRHAEQAIRKAFLEQDLIEAVRLLPESLFFITRLRPAL